MLGGSPASSAVYMRIVEQLGFFSALGVVIVFIAGAASGRILSVPSGIRPAEPVPPATSAAETVPAETITAETARNETIPAQTARTEDTQSPG